MASRKRRDTGELGLRFPPLLACPGVDGQGGCSSLVESGTPCFLCRAAQRRKKPPPPSNKD